MSARRAVIFENLSFTLSAGHALRLAGANGSGKSSLLRQLAGLLPLAAGMLAHVSRHRAICIISAMMTD